MFVSSHQAVNTAAVTSTQPAAVELSSSGHPVQSSSLSASLPFMVTNIKEKAQQIILTIKHLPPVGKHANFTTCSHQTFHFTAALHKVSQGVKLHCTDKVHASTQGQQVIRTLT